MRNVFYFGRKNHYGLRQIKNTKNMCDCVSGYIMRYYNVDTVEKIGSSPNVLAYSQGQYEPEAVIIDRNADYENTFIKRLERTYQEGDIIFNLSEPLRDTDVKLIKEQIKLKVVTEYNAYFKNGSIFPNKHKYDGDLDITEESFKVNPSEFINQKPELDIKFDKSNIKELDRLPNRAPSMSGIAPDDEDESGIITVEKLTAFKLKITYKVLTRMLYYYYFEEGEYENIISCTTFEQCRAKSFYFVVEGKTMRKEKTRFRFTLDADGNLIEPPTNFTPINELKLAENPFLTADAVYRSDEGDIPLYQWVAKNYLTKYKRIRKELEFEKALTPMYLTKEFYKDPQYRLDRPIRNGDYISIADVFDNWMGGTLDESFDKTALGKIADKYLAKKEAEQNISSETTLNQDVIKNEVLKHPLIYRVMNTNTKVKNGVGFQKCECLEVVDINEIEEIFI